MGPLLRLTASLLLLSAPLFGGEALAFDDFFVDRTLRIDYFHVGDASSEEITLDKFCREGIWAGNSDRLIGPDLLGGYQARVYDIATNRLIFSKGYDTYFGEYITTKPALEGKKRTYHETVLIPCPKRPVRFVIEKRDARQLLHPLFVETVDPDSVEILEEAPSPRDKVFKAHISGNPHRKVDIVILGEGYTAEEEDKFRADLQRFTQTFLDVEPYKSLKDRFNIQGVLRPSAQSGVDEPRRGVFKRTALGATFYVFKVDRYLLTEDNRSVRDAAAAVPYDAIFIMANHKRYGGGGIYNQYAILTSDNGEWEKQVFLHEFGHSFVGLADEYYGAPVAYEEFNPPDVEPAAPNITALLDKNRLKWRHLVTDGAAIPTDWGQEEYDALGREYSRLRSEKDDALARLSREGASKEAIDKETARYDELIKEANAKIFGFIEESPLKDTVGAFEGAGYQAKGLYRPMLNCMMHKFTPGPMRFCKVCEEAIRETIAFYTEPSR